MMVIDVVDELTRVVDEHTAAVATVDTGSWRPALRAVGSLVAAVHRLEVALVAHLVGLGAFRAAGAASTAGWLRVHHGLSGGAAKRVEDAARAISAVAVVRDAFERGVLGVEHAALLVGLTDRVRLGDLAESELVPLVDKAGELTFERFRQEVRALEARLDAAAGHDPARGNTVRSHDGDAGRKVWRAELDAESHDIVGNAMDALVDETWRAGHPKDAPAPPVSELARLRADALVEMARRSLHGVDGSPAASVKTGRGTPEVTVFIDWETLRDEVLRDDSVCKLVDGTPLSPATVRRIACTANIIPAVLGGAGDVLDLGTKKRLASAAQHRALAVQHESCAWPGGCDTLVRWCTAHHLQPWKPVAPGGARGPTDLSNLAPLCSAHHHMVHEGGWTLARGPDGTLAAHPPGAAPATGSAPETVPDTAPEADPTAPPPGATGGAPAPEADPTGSASETVPDTAPEADPTAPPPGATGGAPPDRASGPPGGRGVYGSDPPANEGDHP